MKISVGSTNPVKVAAVSGAIKKIWPDAEVISLKTSSGVGEQPRSHEEAIKGATNRAKESMNQSNADIGIGLEGVCVDTEHGMFTDAWVVIVDKEGKVGMGSAGSLLLPEKVAQAIRQGGELGPVMDTIVGEENTKQKMGAVGILTNDLVNRTSSLEKAVIYSLAKFITPEHYK